jgi:hypothetical protein
LPVAGLLNETVACGVNDEARLSLLFREQKRGEPKQRTST